MPNHRGGIFDSTASDPGFVHFNPFTVFCLQPDDKGLCFHGSVRHVWEVLRIGLLLFCMWSGRCFFSQRSSTIHIHTLPKHRQGFPSLKGPCGSSLVKSMPCKWMGCETPTKVDLPDLEESVRRKLETTQQAKRKWYLQRLGVFQFTSCERTLTMRRFSCDMVYASKREVHIVRIAWKYTSIPNSPIILLSFSQKRVRMLSPKDLGWFLRISKCWDPDASPFSSPFRSDL